MVAFPRGTLLLVAGCGIALSLSADGQQSRHGRGYKAPPPTAEVRVTVEKAFNEKPFPNASVVFRAVRNDKVTANLETKTDPEGRASLDLLEVGSHVTVQVIATGYATSATEFDLTGDGRQLLVKLERPRAQISGYTDNVDHPAAVQPGIQEHRKAAPLPATTPAPTTAVPTPASPTAPLQTTPAVSTPGATETSGSTPQ